LIVLWGLPSDGPLAMVDAALRRAGHDPLLLDQRALVGAGIELSVDPQAAARIEYGGETIDLSECTAAYVRPADSAALPGVRRAGPDSAEAHHAAALDWVLLNWSELTDALVVNRPMASMSNGSKPWQSEALRALGFAVPETIITTDPEVVHAFRERHGQIVYKSISGVRSIVAELTDSRLDRLEAVRWCPTQFQQLVAGTDYRVHVVGERVFTTQIVSDAIDYRYAHRQRRSVELRAAMLPDEIAHRCIAATRRFGLWFGGVDLRLDPEGRWYCFEVNTSPGFSYFQHATGQPIDDAVAGLLIAGAGQGFVGARPELAGSPAASATKPAKPLVEQAA
jgi:glutathione synthase/RimK-type ligase-like ATP-grasp enzyme